MFKFYAIYLLFGAYVTLQSLFSWVFSGSDNYKEIISFVALIASGTLVFVATPLMLYNLKRAKIVALVCFATILPFAVYWLSFIFSHDNVDMKRDVSLAACLYFICITMTLMTINAPTCVNDLNKRARLVLTIFPLIFMAGYCFYWFKRF